MAVDACLHLLWKHLRDNRANSCFYGIGWYSETGLGFREQVDLGAVQVLHET